MITQIIEAVGLAAFLIVIIALLGISTELDEVLKNDFLRR